MKIAVVLLAVFSFGFSPACLTEAGAEELGTPQEVRELTVQAQIRRGGDFIAFGFDSVWMMSGNRLIRVDPADNSFIEITVEGAVGPYRGIAVGEGAVWVPDTGSQFIYKINPAENRVVMRIPAVLSDSEGSIGVGNGRVRAVTTKEAGIRSKDYNRVLSCFNAVTGELETTIVLPSRGAAVIFDFGSAWITGVSKGELYRLDATTKQVVATIGLRSRPRLLTSGRGAVWVINQGDGSVQRIDGRSNALMATIEVGAEGVGDIDFGGEFVWLTTLTTPLLQIDPAANQLRGQFRAPRGAGQSCERRGKWILPRRPSAGATLHEPRSDEGTPS